MVRLRVRVELVPVFSPPLRAFSSPLVIQSVPVALLRDPAGRAWERLRLLAEFVLPVFWTARLMVKG